MKKLIVEGPKKTVVKEVPMPEMDDNHVLVKILFCGVCRSEHYAWENAEANNGVDSGIGHEPVGIIEKVGKNVKGFKVGDRVTGLMPSACAEYTTVLPKNIILVPENLDSEDATGEPLACLVSAVSKVPITFPGESSVAVVGCGYMGCGAISLLKLRGASKVVAVDTNKESLKNALLYGADEAYLPEELPEEYIADTANKNGFDFVMEWAESDESLNLAIRLTKTLGFLGVGAYHTGPSRTINMQLANVKAIDMLSTHPRDYDRLIKSLHEAIKLLSNGTWKYAKLPVKVYSLDQFDLAHQEMDDKYGKWMKAVINCQTLGGEPYVKNN